MSVCKMCDNVIKDSDKDAHRECTVCMDELFVMHLKSKLFDRIMEIVNGNNPYPEDADRTIAKCARWTIKDFEAVLTMRNK